MDGYVSVQLRCDHLKLLVQGIIAAITDSGPVHVQAAGFIAVQIVEQRTSPQLISGLVLDISAQCLKQGMARRNPLPSWILVQHLFVKNDILIFPAQPTELRFQFCADSDQVARQSPHTIHVIAAAALRESDACAFASILEKIFYDFRHQSTLLGLLCLADDR